MVMFSKIFVENINEFPTILPRYYGGVILVGVGSFALHIFLGSRVMKARKEINFPVGATALGSVFLLGRILYYKGYTSGDPNKRRRGMVGMLALAALMLMSAFFGGSHLCASLRQRGCCPMFRSSPNLI